jgi:UDP-N-acetyl-D-mannosaminuronic acid dehydrogenase
MLLEIEWPWGAILQVEKAVCVVGLGYVGLTLAVALGNAGFPIVGIERDPRIRKSVEAGRAHFPEPGLDDLLAEQVANGAFIVHETLPSNPDISTYIVTVGTPLGSDGRVNLTDFESVLQAIAAVLKDSDLVVLRSTVKVGTTRRLAAKILDASGADYDLAFCPERTVEGKALFELKNLPQIVSGMSERSIGRAAELFGKICPYTVRVGDVGSAELAKLVNNTFRDMTFAFANEVAEMCEALGVPFSDVIEAACRDYPRCQLPKPGLVGGPCLEKDPYILAEGLREVGYDPKLSIGGRHVNESMVGRSIDQMMAVLRSMGSTDLSSAKISILGLAFKGRPETNDLRGTMAKPVIEALRSRIPNARIGAFDPVVEDIDFTRLGVQRYGRLEDAFDGSTLVIVQNNHPIFADMNVAHLAEMTRPPALIYDYWNLFEPSIVKAPGCIYAGFGNLKFVANRHLGSQARDHSMSQLRAATA